MKNNKKKNDDHSALSRLVIGKINILAALPTTL